MFPEFGVPTYNILAGVTPHTITNSFYKMSGPWPYARATPTRDKGTHLIWCDSISRYDCSARREAEVLGAK
jgi:hypothetical protein